MRLVFRLLTIWLLALAVPAQGMAGVTMAFCGPNHHGGATAHAADAAPTGHAHHGSDTNGAPAHHAQTAAAEPDATSTTAASATADTADHSSPPSPGGHAAKQKCSACASCCSMGAILNTVLTVPAAPVMPTVFSAVVPSVDPFAADGPDRPPRIVFA